MEIPVQCRVGVGVGEEGVDGAPDSKAKPWRRLAEAERRQKSVSTAVRRSSEPRVVVKAALGIWAAGWEERRGSAGGLKETAGDLPVLALHVECAVNQMVEVIEAEVEQRVLDVVLKTLHELLLRVAIIRFLGRGVASELKETITILRDRHSPLKWKKKDV